MEKRAFEQTGLVPRSIIRTFDRFRRQLLNEAESSVIQEFRVSRYQVLVSVKCLVTLLIIPLVVNFLTKTFFFKPLTEYLWNTQQNEIFLNLYQENRAFSELHDFEEKLFFESLIETQSAPFKRASPLRSIQGHQLLARKEKEILVSADSSENNRLPYAFQIEDLNKPSCAYCSRSKNNTSEENVIYKTEKKFEPYSNPADIGKYQENQASGRKRALKQSQLTPSLSLNLIEDGQAGLSPFYLENSLSQKFQQKTIELAIYYNQQSIEAITNLFGDFITFITISFLFIWMEPQIIILKSFLTESIYSLSDTTKSFLLILLTDLLVGFHSPRGWEIFLEIILRHFGLPENQDFIFLFVATFPVLLDTVFKYWIFRYLNQISPSTVATYHNMIE